jgi:hypothetical protein
MTSQDKATSRAESGGAREIIEHCASLAVSYMQDLPSWDGTASDCGYLRNAIVNGDHSALASHPADHPSGDALKSMESMMRPETVVQAKKEAAEILADIAEMLADLAARRESLLAAEREQCRTAMVASQAEVDALYARAEKAEAEAKALRKALFEIASKGVEHWDAEGKPLSAAAISRAALDAGKD